MPRKPFGALPQFFLQRLQERRLHAVLGRFGVEVRDLRRPFRRQDFIPIVLIRFDVADQFPRQVLELLLRLPNLEVTLQLGHVDQVPPLAADRVDHQFLRDPINPPESTGDQQHQAAAEQ